MTVIQETNRKVALLVDFGVGKTGLATVGYTLYRSDGTVFQARTTTGVAEAVSGTGIYRVELAATVFTAEFQGYVIWDTGEASARYAPEDIEVTAIVSSLSGAQVNVTSPVAVDLLVTVVKGDDYNASDSRALEWSTSSSTEWPDLTGATISLGLSPVDGSTAPAEVAGSVVTATGATKKVRVALTAAYTGALLTGTKAYAYDVQATLSGSSRKVTLARGYMTVLPSYTT